MSDEIDKLLAVRKVFGLPVAIPDQKPRAAGLNDAEIDLIDGPTLRALLKELRDEYARLQRVRDGYAERNGRLSATIEATRTAATALLAVPSV